MTHDCKVELRNAALRITPARLGVLAVLEQSEMPLSVSDIIFLLNKQAIPADRVTVFRIINSLTEKGLATLVQLGEGQFRYEYSGKAEHHHFVCEVCGSITDISDCNISEFENHLQQKKGLLIKRHSLEFFGICANCQK